MWRWCRSLRWSLHIQSHAEWVFSATLNNPIRVIEALSGLVSFLGARYQNAPSYAVPSEHFGLPDRLAYWKCLQNTGHFWCQLLLRAIKLTKPKNNVEHRITAEEFARFAEEFKSESDRAAVILGTSQLDLLLYQLLEGFLLPCTSGKDELLEGDSPLATFSSRINISYRLGLIDADFARALHLIRRIRNSFAHEISSASLHSGAHRDRIRELVNPLAKNWALSFMINQYFDGIDSAGTQFRAAIGIMCFRLDGAIRATKRISFADAQTFVPSDKEKNEEQSTIER